MIIGGPRQKGRISMDLIEVNQKTCNKDGLCAMECPAGIISFEKGSFPKPTPGADELCSRCGHCVAVCPKGSLTHRDMPVEKCPHVRKDLLLSEEQCEHFLRNRRSIRVYRDQPVPRSCLERLIDIARYAPSGHNTQDVDWLVIADSAELHHLSDLAVDWLRWRLENDREMALLLHLDRTIVRWGAGYDVILRNAPAVVVVHGLKNNWITAANCTIALTYLELAATSMGLGCCWAGHFMGAAGNFPPMAEALQLPEGNQCFGAMMVGYPRFIYSRLPFRKTPRVAWRGVE
jgi:nitroreductase/ferredoxin